ncbi:hypothetical protein B0H17DRAFT_1212399 [Mycena rosella]|uniref:F-box domain-containing protein n=1 Tax=Mycena rosella TaxID=1033263 RepID=A0AAD7CVX1_MYCRO|nr:hypothetical protein B0H17DRAFT_1212399 [Mycena rosella]
MFAALDFPAELQDMIIDHMHREKQALGTCGLVCKSWLRSSRHHLFGSATLRNHDLDGFLQLLHSPLASFLQSIASLSIELDEDAMVQLFGNITRLDIHLVAFDTPRQMTAFISRFPRLEEMSLYPTVLGLQNAPEELRTPDGPPNLRTPPPIPHLHGAENTPWTLLSALRAPITTLTIVLKLDTVDVLDNLDWGYLNRTLQTLPHLAALRRLHFMVHCASGAMDQVEGALRRRLSEDTARGVVDVSVLHTARIFTQGLPTVPSFTGLTGAVNGIPHRPVEASPDEIYGTELALVTLIVSCVTALGPSFPACAPAVAEEGANTPSNTACLAAAAKGTAAFPSACSPCAAPFGVTDPGNKAQEAPTVNGPQGASPASDNHVKRAGPGKPPAGGQPPAPTAAPPKVPKALAAGPPPADNAKPGDAVTPLAPQPRADTCDIQACVIALGPSFPACAPAVTAQGANTPSNTAGLAAAAQGSAAFAQERQR